MAQKTGRNVPKGASRIVPPAWMLFAICVMIAIWYWVPGRTIVPDPYHYVGCGIFLIGVALAIYGKAQFDKVETPVIPFTESTSLVTSGPFRVTRNPMYLAMTMGLIGVGLFLGKVAPFVMVPLFMLWIQAKFIRHEEVLMAETFGDDYHAYKKQVRRWI